MKIIKAGYEILDEINEKEVMKKIERIARVCYKSENAINDKSAVFLIRALIKINMMLCLSIILLVLNL